MAQTANQMYVDQGGMDQQLRPGIQTNDSSYGRNSNNPYSQNNGSPYSLLQRLPPEPQTDFQRLARASTGQVLPLFGRNLFERPQSTFMPPEQTTASSDYVVGPGDQILLRFWGPETFNSQLTVDPSGMIYVPKVGSIHVAGLRYDELEKHVRQEISQIYRKFDVSVNLGHLRSIQVYVVGDARYPNAYTVSALSTMVNVLFASGGPTSQGSMRRIELRRANQPPQILDLYDLLLAGDKTKDLHLEQGDVIFIPAKGQEVALAGNIRRPAIYELRGETTVSDLLKLGGGFDTVADTMSVSLERIDTDHMRRATTVDIATEGQSTILRNGDIVTTKHISPAYSKSVTIRGNLANPGRFAWHPGMRLSDIIPDRMSLLTNDYWAARNQLGVPVPLFEPMSKTNLSLTQKQQRLTDTRGYSTNQQGQTSSPLTTSQIRSGENQGNVDELSTEENTRAKRASASALALQNQRLASSSVDTGNGGSQSPLDANNEDISPTGAKLNRIQIPIGEIDWSYAVIERLDPNTLKSVLVPFNLGKLVKDHDDSQNLELQPDDIVTILSQADISVPVEEQTKYVRLEGEFVAAGVYSVKPGETLDDLVRRAGGITAQAYLYGSSFYRESARGFQQQRLDEYITRLSADLDRAAAVRSASSTTGATDPTALTAQRSIVNQLRSMRATGRIVLPFAPESSAIDSIPNIPLENGDVFHVPSRPNTVGVLGAVYGQSVFLYDSKKHLGDYVSQAGNPNRIADAKHAFIIRANGSVYSREYAKGFFTNTFDNSVIHPGDAIVVPEKMIKPDALHTVLEYSQIFANFGVLAAVLATVR
ncbi:SLBB domain-containing protein [Terriglobus sp. ADX1]|uniref:SLBB domain-containing protein n=1 Tax=Terriglobus sp. ADX1 TaxID=2794063 RepID=UPI002FE58EF8